MGGMQLHKRPAQLLFEFFCKNVTLTAFTNDNQLDTNPHF